MYKIEKHPILDLPKEEYVEFQFEGRTVRGQKGKTIAAALHQAGLIVHSHSTSGRNRSLECGIGKCGACEMLVDGQVRRICITSVDGVKEARVTLDRQTRDPKFVRIKVAFLWAKIYITNFKSGNISDDVFVFPH